MDSIKNFLKAYYTPEPINDLKDYRRVKRWTITVITLYTIVLLIAVSISLYFIFSFPEYTKIIVELSEMPAFIAYPLFLLIFWYVSLGHATTVMNFPKMIKSAFTGGIFGLMVGKDMETTHVNVSHEYGNTYKVSSYTTNPGCMSSIIGGFIGFVVMGIFYACLGPYITLKKLHGSLNNLKKYSAK